MGAGSIYRAPHFTILGNGRIKYNKSVRDSLECIRVDRVVCVIEHDDDSRLDVDLDLCHGGRLGHPIL